MDKKIDDDSEQPLIGRGGIQTANKSIKTADISK